MSTINLTQHPATAEQLAAGVVEPQSVIAEAVKPATKKQVQDLLTFNFLPDEEELYNRATELAQIAMYSGAKSAMIGGAPFFMSALEHALKKVHVRPVYAFSVRESVEVAAADGTVTKTNVFKHLGFVEVK